MLEVVLYFDVKHYSGLVILTVHYEFDSLKRKLVSINQRDEIVPKLSYKIEAMFER